MTNKVDKKVEADDVSSVKAELEVLRNELKILRTEHKQFDNKTQEAIEEARDDMLLDDEVGGLFIDEKYKEDGYFYRIVDSTRPGRIEQHIKRGYEIVHDDATKVGQSTVSNTSRLTSAVTVELGVNKGSVLGVLMRIPLDKYKKRQEAKVRRNKEHEAAMMQESVNKSDFGSIEIGSFSVKK